MDQDDRSPAEGRPETDGPAIEGWSPAAIRHLLSYGQSLSGGTQGRPALSLAQPYANITWEGPGGQGPRHYGPYDAVKPLVEDEVNWPTASSAANQGETVCSVWANGLVERYADEDGIAPGGQDWCYLASAPGLGSAAIAQFVPGTEQYARLMASVAGGVAVGAARGATYAYECTGWMQGERDDFLQTPRALYAATLIQLEADIARDATAVTGQPWRPLFISYQTAAWRFYGHARPIAALAHRDAQRQGPWVRIACPNYIFDYSHPTGAATGDHHFNNVSYQFCARYFARLQKRLIEDRRAGRPQGIHCLDVTGVLWLGRVIEVTFALPPPPPGVEFRNRVEFDTAWVTATANMGFDLWTADGLLPDAIRSVTIVSRRRVLIITDVAYPAGTILTYGWGRPQDAGAGQMQGRQQGARGNLRDRYGDIAGESYVGADGLVRRLDNWALIFDHVKGG
ncbi:hypothetical protein [Inquilinus sp. Marseille-Q2685]|uniref:hypothetical protein n=1 Tax=Inquilinus sp. Marseille-Q2685 TaxID=2866581 RepID=UPI001CE3BF3F|nr:hypothetical protein [Inquilinus sp. Marseille-Q2685]